jgi:hypothetical protein
MYFIIKYINATTTAINTNKHLFYPHFEFSGIKGGNFSFKSIQKVNNHWLGRKGWEKESNTERCKIVKYETACVRPSIYFMFFVTKVDT